MDKKKDQDATTPSVVKKTKDETKSKESKTTPKDDKKKKEKSKKEEEQRRNAEDNLDENAEIAELEGTKAGELNPNAYKEMYNLFPQVVYDAYGKIKTFARKYVSIR